MKIFVLNAEGVKLDYETPDVNSFLMKIFVLNTDGVRLDRGGGKSKYNCDQF